MRNTIALAIALWVMWTSEPGCTDILEYAATPDGPWAEQPGPYEAVDMGAGRLDYRVAVLNENFKFFRVKRVLTNSTGAVR